MVKVVQVIQGSVWSSQVVQGPGEGREDAVGEKLTRIRAGRRAGSTACIWVQGRVVLQHVV